VPPLTLTTSIQYVKGVGPRKAEALAAKGYRSVEDLLYHLPFRYEDRGHFHPIADLSPGMRATVRGRILASRLIRTRRRGFTILDAAVEDNSAGLSVIFYNQPWLKDILKAGRDVILFGEAALSRYRGRPLQMVGPQYEIVSADDDTAIHTGRVVPIYQRLGDLSPRMLRSILHAILEALPAELPDPLPPSVFARRRLMPRGAALRAVHFPPPDADLDLYQSRGSPAHQRLILEEFFMLQVALGLRRRGMERERRAEPYATTPEIRRRLAAILPFHLTAGQKEALRQIVGDLTSDHPMNRLLQGDVGSGKTIVATLAMILAVENGRQAALMAPTELLAEQHHRVLGRLLEKTRYQVQLLTGAMTAARRRPVLRAVANGLVQILIGTHALIQDKVVFSNLGLVVVDEQHRFGVVQRAALRGKARAGRTPDVLVMTATPIPRSLALTIYGDLEMTLIKDMPPGRRPVKTHLRSESSRNRIYDFIRREALAGRQAYVVLPLVEESEKSDLRAAVKMHAELSRVFSSLSVGLLHGRMKPDEREATMRQFVGGEIHILVSTTVIEVGIDVPNASLMVVEHAERFGLSQLHQLRGRVGRGPHASHCVLVHGEDPSDEARLRLRVLGESTDGFHIAEKDLEIRGPGEFMGTRQSGLPEIRIGNIIRDYDLLAEARAGAQRVLEEIRTETPAAGSRHQLLLDHMSRQWGARIGLMEVG